MTIWSAMQPKTALMIRQSNAKGLTLIELIISIGIFVVLISSSVVGLYIYTAKITPDLHAKSQVGLQYRIAFEEFSKWVSQAIQVEPSFGSYGSGSSSVVLKIPAINGSNQIIANTYDRIVFQGATERILPDPSSSRLATTRKLIDDPFLITILYYTLNDQIASDRSQTEKVYVQFWKQLVINGQPKTFVETRYFSLRNH